MEHKNQFQWYVLKAISGKEGKVKEYIEAARKTNPDFAEWVSQVLIPTEKVVANRGNKRIVKEKNSMPGYVLVEANLVDECYPRLRNVPNVLGFLTDGPNSIKPRAIRQAEVNSLLGKVDEMSDEELLEVSYSVGETLRVTDGPFSGFNGEVEEILPEKRKLKVIVTIFGRKTSLELGFSQVEKE
jgi:transcriptional antiterminator NusG